MQVQISEMFSWYSLIFYMPNSFENLILYVLYKLTSNIKCCLELIIEIKNNRRTRPNLFNSQIYNLISIRTYLVICNLSLCRLFGYYFLGCWVGLNALSFPFSCFSFYCERLPNDYDLTPHIAWPPTLLYILI